MLLYDALVNLLSPQSEVSGVVAVTVALLQSLLVLGGYSIALTLLGYWPWFKFVAFFSQVVLSFALLWVLSSRDASLDQLVIWHSFYFLGALALVTLAVLIILGIEIVRLVKVSKVTKVKAERKMAAKIVFSQGFSAPQTQVLRTIAGFIIIHTLCMMSSFLIYRALLSVGNAFTFTMLIAGNIGVFFALKLAVTEFIFPHLVGLGAKLKERLPLKRTHEA